MELSEIQRIFSPENQESESDYFSFPATRQCHMAGVQNDWNKLTLAALETASLINPFESDLPEGTIIPSVDTQNWPAGHRGCDIRPRPELG